jgi:hypothetical protein
VDHSGKLIEDVGWFWDHANERYVIAHDDLTSNSVCPSGAHDPIAWRRFKKRDACEPEAFKDHTELYREWIDDAIARGIPGDFAFDSYFTSAKVLNPIEGQKRSYVGDLKLNHKVIYEGREQGLQAVARQILWQTKKSMRVDNRRYWCFSTQMRIPDVKHPVRIVLFWMERSDGQASKALVSNRLTWEVIRMVLVYRHPWTGTETFHGDGKQELGLGERQTRHVYLVSAAYSLLMHTLHQNRPQEWARRLTATIGAACRACKGEQLGQLIDWIVDKLADDH